MLFVHFSTVLVMGIGLQVTLKCEAVWKLWGRVGGQVAGL